MKTKAELEAALERSLRRQINAPRLNDRFDAAVWSRIEAQESRSPVKARNFPVASPKLAHWLGAMNVIGLAGVAIFLITFGAQMLGTEGNVSLPEISAAVNEPLLTTINIGIAAASLLVGFAFTPWGQRLRDEFR